MQMLKIQHKICGAGEGGRQTAPFIAALLHLVGLDSSLESWHLPKPESNTLQTINNQQQEKTTQKSRRAFCSPGREQKSESWGWISTFETFHSFPTKLYTLLGIIHSIFGPWHFETSPKWDKTMYFIYLIANLWSIPTGAWFSQYLSPALDLRHSARCFRLRQCQW